MKYNVGEMYDRLFDALAKSTFRSRFKLKDKDKEYISQKGLDTIKSHAKDFIAKRIAPADIPNDGKQTPMRGQKWHKFNKGVELNAEQQEYLVEIIMEWIKRNG